MSCWIDDNLVSEVLLATGWETVLIGSFELDAYEFCRDGKAFYQNNGQVKEVCTTAARWIDYGTKQWTCAPLTAILALRTATRVERKDWPQECDEYQKAEAAARRKRFEADDD